MAKNLSSFFKSRTRKKPPVPKSATEESASDVKQDRTDTARLALGGLGFVAGVAGAFVNKNAKKAQRIQMGINLRLAKERRANVQQLGQIDIADQMGLSLANRMSGATDFSGSSAEVFAQEGRNMNFSLRSQLHSMILQEVEMQNQIYAMKHAERSGLLNDILSSGAKTGEAIASAYAGGAGGGAGG